MFKRSNIRPAERRQYVAGLAIAGAAIVGLGVEIAYMVTAVPF
jgi:hypothetical protein